MNRIGLLRAVNAVLLIVIAIQIVTGLSMFFELDLAGLPLVHRFNSLLLTALVATHVWLNWSWIRASLFRR